MAVQVSVPQRLKRTLTEGKKQANKAIGLSVKVIIVQWYLQDFVNFLNECRREWRHLALLRGSVAGEGRERQKVSACFDAHSSLW